MKDIFVSHSSLDHDIAYSLVEYLEDNGVECFIAPRDIAGGANYPTRLMKAMRECKAVVLVASSAINTSEHVLNEIEVLVGNRIPILPVLIEDFDFIDELRYFLGRKHQVVAYPDDPATYFPKVLNGLEQYVTFEKKTPAKKATEPQETAPLAGTRTVFEYVPERGIMINPEDHQRNVSFRTDTLINMMGGIFESVAKIADAETAYNIFFDSGYVSGKNFAERINSTWDTGYSFEEIGKKLNKWCAFDSAVGWGKFSISMDFDEENDTFSGKLKINEAFLVDNAKKRKVCGFIKGYCTGVLETLMGSVDVDLHCSECPMTSRFKCCCVFDVTTKG